MVAGLLVLVAAVTAVVIVSADEPGGTPASRGPGRAPGDGDVPSVLGPGAPEVGAPAPDFVLPPIDGGPAVRLSDFRGRPVVVNFWASWCRPCRKEFPLLRAARAEHRAEGLEVLGVSYRDIAADSRRFAREERARWPLLRDPGGSVANAYGVRAIPQTFFIDADGVVRARVFGIPSASDLEADLKTIL